MTPSYAMKSTSLFLLFLIGLSLRAAPPNILFIAVDDLRPELRAHIEIHYPTYTGAPETFESPNDTSWTYFKKVLDARAAAEGES